MDSTSIEIQLRKVLRKDMQVYSFVEELATYSELLFFGGSIRDLYVEKEAAHPRDFDIVLNSECDINRMESYFYKKGYKFKKNRFDGFKVDVGNTEVDLWFMNNTWAFKNNKVKESVENLTSTVYLNLDGIAYNYNKNELYKNVFEESINSKKIDIVLEENPQEKLNLLRALVFKKKYNYDLSENLILRYIHFCDESYNLANELYDLQLEHYGQEKYTRCNIENDLTEIYNSI